MSNAAHHDQDDLRLLRESVHTLLERAGGVARARKIRDEDGGWDGPVMTERARACRHLGRARNWPFTPALPRTCASDRGAGRHDGPGNSMAGA